MTERPRSVFDPAVQHERTALAWERTGLAIIVAGALFVARAQGGLAVLFLPVGVGAVLFGLGILVWSGRHYEELHGVLRAGLGVTHPRAVRVVGVVTTLLAAAALALGLLSV